MKKNFTPLVSCFLIVFSSLVYAQDIPIKPGKVTMAELKMKQCPLDSNARAMIICDYGKSYIEYSEANGFQVFFDRILRIKIFTKEGYDWADHSISLYKTGTNKEKVSKLKAFTYNLEGGKIIKEKLKSSDVYSEEKSLHIDLRKFSMPQVRVGSVIEIEYTVASDFFFNLNSWYFQYDIPSQWSEYNVFIPEYYNYKRTYKGYVPLAESESITERKSITLTSKERSRGLVTQTNFDSQKVDYNELVEHWATKDIPAFIVEEPLTSVENYISKMEFELSSIHPPYGVPTYYTKTWEDINKLLMDDEDFGSQLRGDGYLKVEIAEINQADTSEMKKMVHAYNFIQKHMKWNGYNSIYVEDNLKSAFNDQSGNSAEINLLLVVLLNSLGIESNPVILSTRANGIIYPTQPYLSSFNYVIAQAELDGQFYLLDATDPKMPFGMLPVRALNGEGRLISKDKSEWVSLDTDKPYKTFWMYTLSLNEEMEFTGEIQAGFNDYAAIIQRNKMTNYTNDDDYIKNIQDSNTGLTINSFELINGKIYDEPYKQKFDVTIIDKTEGSEDIIYFNPMFYEAITENPFKLVERKYPVEFAYPTNNTCMMMITIPDGYKVDEMPESVLVQLPDNGGSFRYTSKIIGNKLQIMSKIEITNKTFLPENYEYLKEFYNHVIAKHAESVVLSKE